MRTLYVTDLDGTLLRSDETISEYSKQVINGLAGQGILFSYATARSYVTSVKVTRGLTARIPLIVYNGAFVIDNVSGRILLSNYFGPEGRELLADLLSKKIFPIVYAMVDGVEHFSYVKGRCSKEMLEFLSTRRGDRRERPVNRAEELFEGDLFYITCIDAEEKLEPLFHQHKDGYHTVYQRDLYTHAQWLEFMPLSTSKSNAIQRLQAFLKCDKLVVFGDGRNDIDMFQMADECYAVNNAVDELKQMATAVIGSNDEDGVARWLSEHAEGICGQ